MDSNKYILKATADRLAYHFTSIGPAGNLDKRIEFQDIDAEIDGKPVYNLAFGDIAGDGEMDDTAESNNGDIIMIMSTVIASIYEFTSVYPDRYVYFTGSNEQRTQFYQAIMRRKYSELGKDFFLFGVTVTRYAREVEDFVNGKDYDAFMVLRKLKEA